MKKILSVITRYICYLIIGFIGVGLGSLIVGSGTNVFTSWIPYIGAMVLIVIDYLLITKDKGK